MRVVADSHAIVWYLQGSKRLSGPAAATLAEAEATSELVVSIATLLDLWYVTQTTRAVTVAQLHGLRDRLVSSKAVTLEPVGLAIDLAFRTSGIRFASPMSLIDNALLERRGARAADVGGR